MEDNKNPILEPEDYFKPYKENIETMKNNPELIEFDKLCYELFEMNPIGKKFLEIATDKYLIHSLVQRGSPTYQIDVLWQEGFKDAYRYLKLGVNSHNQRIKAGMNSK